MIHIKATVRGDPDVTPFTRVFQFVDGDDEQIFVNSVKMVKEKLDKNLKINVNEVLLVYCYYVASQIRARKSAHQVEKNASQILSSKDVMIGVPESIRELMFDAVIDMLPRQKIVIKEPIPVSGYILAAN